MSAVPPTENTKSLKSAADLRQEYKKGELSESSVSPDAMQQFGRWFEDAQRAELPEPNALTLATVSAAGQPSARVVLMKAYDERGIVFYTNYQSRKGRDLAESPLAAVCFFWEGLERQVRLEGRVEKATREETESYWRSRPVSSQIGAWVSQQSAVITSRDELEKTNDELKQTFAGKDVPVPEHWGGYRVIAATVEFWQGRRSRLHDRLLYARSDGGWRIQRLAP